MSFENFPCEITELIFGFTSWEMRIVSRFVCKEWNDINKGFSSKSWGSEIVHLLIRSKYFKVAKWVIRQGANYKKRAITKVAVIMGDVDMFTFLISRDAHYDHHRILGYAAYSGNVEMMKFLVKMCHVKLTYDLLEDAILGHNVECIKYTLELRKDFRKYHSRKPKLHMGMDIIENIFKSQKFDVLEECWNIGVNDIWGYDFLWNCSTTIEQLEWLKNKNVSGIQFGVLGYDQSVEIVEWLYNNGRQYDDQDLSVAISDGKIPIVKFLLEKYPTSILEPNAIVHGSIETLQWLVDYGIKWSKYYTQWILRVDRLDVAQWLWKKGILFVHLQESWEIGDNIKTWLKTLE